MLTQADLQEANGLVARFGLARKMNASHEVLFGVQRRLLMLGVVLDDPVAAPDPHAPAGGSTVAMRKAA